MLVFAFEECWPLAEAAPSTASVGSITEFLQHLARSEKDKDAAGLGALAFLCKEDPSALDCSGTNLTHVHNVAQAFDNPDIFWIRALERAEPEALPTVQVAQRAFKNGGWLWDRAFAAAGAYLAVEGGLPVEPKPASARDCPFWAAIDKHTPAGRAALRRAASCRGETYDRLAWSSFYFESAQANSEKPSKWWCLERELQLRQLGLTVGRAQSLWTESRSDYEELVAGATAKLREEVLSSSAIQPALF
jgi:hypothetical protein